LESALDVVLPPSGSVEPILHEHDFDPQVEVEPDGQAVQIVTSLSENDAAGHPQTSLDEEGVVPPEAVSMVPIQVQPLSVYEEPVGHIGGLHTPATDVPDPVVAKTNPDGQEQNELAALDVDPAGQGMQPLLAENVPAAHLKTQSSPTVLEKPAAVSIPGRQVQMLLPGAEIENLGHGLQLGAAPIIFEGQRHDDPLVGFIEPESVRVGYGIGNSPKL